MRNKVFHILYWVGMILVISPLINLISDSDYVTWIWQYIYFHLAVLGYFFFFGWSLLVLLFRQGSRVTIVEGLLGFFVTALQTLSVRSCLLFILGISQKDKSDIVPVFGWFCNLTTLMLLLCPLVSKVLQKVLRKPPLKPVVDHE